MFQIIQTLFQSNLNNIANWCTKNQLYLNIKECFQDLFSKIVTYSKLIVTCSQFIRICEMSDLGVVFKSKFAFQSHLI